jgi:enoyl-CoA hydratase/carnithine racemase
VSVPPAELEGLVAELAAAVARTPVAAAVLAQVLRMGERLAFNEALVLESLAYSTLLAGAEFRAWRAATPVRTRPRNDASRVRLAREDGVLIVAFARSEARNAVDAAMRDELVEALAFAAVDPEQTPVLLTGDGPSFSAGGDLDEFGRAPDPAAAHVIRVAQSPARLLRGLGERAGARVHGACIGAGIEIPASAARVTASPDAWFRLPEVAMGLIPGAGGTASIPRRIGRERTCFTALSGRAIDVSTALAWGLVDALEGAP